MTQMFKADRFLAGMIFALAMLFLFAPAKATEFRPVCTPDRPEMISSFAEDSVKRIVMQVQIPDVRKGDWFEVTGQIEATGNNGQFVDFARAIVMASTPTGIDASGGGAWVTESSDENLDPVGGFWCSVVGLCTDHHNAPSLSNMIANAPANLPVGYFNFLVWGKTSPDEPGYTAIINAGYGKMCVAQHRQ